MKMKPIPLLLFYCVLQLLYPALALHTSAPSAVSRTIPDASDTSAVACALSTMRQVLDTVAQKSSLPESISPAPVRDRGDDAYLPLAFDGTVRMQSNQLAGNAMFSTFDVLHFPSGTEMPPGHIPRQMLWISLLLLFLLSLLPRGGLDSAAMFLFYPEKGCCPTRRT